MNRAHRFCLGALGLLLCSCPLRAAVAADPPAPSAGERAADLYKQATERYRTNDLREAEKLYSEAWALQHSYDIATNLGAVELDLKKHRAAAEHLSFALRAFPARGKQEERETIAQRLKMARAEVVTLHVSVNADKADVSVNGKRVGVSPIAEDIFVDAGPVTVEAGLDGYQRATRQLTGQKGDTLDVKLALVPLQKPEERSMLGPAIAFGAGGAGLVLGAVTAGVAAAGKSRLSEVCAPSGACDETARGELDTALTMARVSTAGFIVAGLGAAVGVTLLLLPTKSKTTVAAQIGPGFVGVKGVF